MVMKAGKTDSKKRSAPTKDSSPGGKKQKLNDGKPQQRKTFVKKGSQPPGKQNTKVSNGKPAAKAADKPAAKRDENGKLVQLSTHEKREKVRAKNAAFKKNFNIIQESAALWEALRPKNTSPEERVALVDQIMKKVDGKLLELASHHTASRIIQFCAKNGTKEQRAQIMEQVKANIVALAKSKYGHHLVRKLVNVSKKDQIPELVRAFQGHMAELLRHPQGCDVLVDLYDVASTACRNSMCAEFYGREFALFGGVAKQGSNLSGLASLLEGVDTGKRRRVMQHMTKALAPVMEKALLHPPMVHRLLRDFLECAPSLSVEDAVDTLSATGASLLKMVHTHDGAAVVNMLIGYGTAKDRKRMVKGMKGHIATMAVNEWAYSVLISTLSAVDDTSLVNKTICAELKDMIDEAVEDSHACRILLQLLHPNNSRYLPPAVMQMLNLPQRVVKGSSGKMVTDIDGEEDEDDLKAGFQAAAEEGDDGEDLFASKNKKKGASKQGGDKKRSQPDSEDGGGDGEVKPGEEQNAGAERVLGISKKTTDARRKELLSFGGKDSLAAAITKACAAKAGALLRTPVCCDLIVEVASGGLGGMLQELVPEGVAAVQQAIIDEVNGVASAAATDNADDTNQGPSAPAAEHVFTHYYASRALRRLLLASEEQGASGTATEFAEKLWSSCCKGKCKTWLGGHGEKVLAALYHSGSAKVRTEAAKELAPLVKPKSAEEWAGQFLQGSTHHQQHAGKKERKEQQAGDVKAEVSATKEQPSKPVADKQAKKKAKK